MSHMNFEHTPGRRGRTKSTWRDDTNLGGLLLRLRKENPDADREEIRPLYLAKAENVLALIHEALNRCFDNDWNNIETSERRAERKKQEAEQKQREAGQPASTTAQGHPSATADGQPADAAADAASQAPAAGAPVADAAPKTQPTKTKTSKISAAELDAIDKRLVESVLLDWLMPNGKKLRDCTFAEGHKFQAEIPAWMATFLDKGKPDQIIGHVVNEAELRQAAPQGWV